MCWSENVQQHSLNCTRSTDLSVKVFRCRRGMPSPTKTIHMQNGMKMWPGLNGSTWITPLRQDKQYSHAKMSWLYLRFQCGSPFVPFISVTFGCVHADRLIATFFHPPIIVQDHNKNTNHRRLECLGYVTLVCHSQATTLSIRAGKVKSAPLSHIYIWTNDSPMGSLWPSKYSTWCNQGWCMVLVGNWSWWLTQYDTWFHSVIAAPSWIGHKPTETYWPWWKLKWAPCLYMTHFVTENLCWALKKTLTGCCEWTHLRSVTTYCREGRQESCLCSTSVKRSKQCFTNA